MIFENGKAIGGGQPQGAGQAISPEAIDAIARRLAEMLAGGSQMTLTDPESMASVAKAMAGQRAETEGSFKGQSKEVQLESDKAKANKTLDLLKNIP